MTKTMAMTAMQGMILERLIEAFETDIALPVRVGPRAFGTAMPEYVHTAAENFAREREDWKETGGQRTAHERKMQALRLERRRLCSPERITRMEEAFGWIRQAIWDEEARQVLLAYAEVKARGWDWSRYVRDRNRRNPRKTAWVKRTIYRWIVRSIQAIERVVLQSSTVWPQGGGFTDGTQRGKTSGQIDNIGFACVAGSRRHSRLRRTT